MSQKTVEGNKMSKEMPCGHTWAEFVSCDTEGGTLMCGICEPIGKRVAQLLVENVEHLKQITVLETDFVKWSEVVAKARLRLEIDMIKMVDKIDQLKAERDAFKLLYTMSTKPVDATQEEIVKAHQIIQAFFKAEKGGEKDLSASEALKQIGEIPGVQEAYRFFKLEDQKYLDEQIKKVMERGPTRVVINSEGDAISPARAERDHDIVPDVVFIRDDGWSLGAPDYLADVAQRIWADKWIGSFRPQDHMESEA